MCHLLLLLPVLGLPLFWLLPLTIAAPVYALLLAFSIWLYRALMRSLHQPAEGGREGLAHANGEVLEADGGRLLVRVQGELWTARGPADLHPGERVVVTAVEGLMLRVDRRVETPRGMTVGG